MKVEMPPPLQEATAKNLTSNWHFANELRSAREAPAKERVRFQHYPLFPHHKPGRYESLARWNAHACTVRGKGCNVDNSILYSAVAPVDRFRTDEPSTADLCLTASLGGRPSRKQEGGND